jgi:hypothetical protein
MCFGETAASVPHAIGGLTRFGTVPTRVIWNYITENPTPKVVKIQKAISSQYAPFIMMRFTAKNDIQREAERSLPADRKKPWPLKSAYVFIRKNRHEKTIHGIGFIPDRVCWNT